MAMAHVLEANKRILEEALSSDVILTAGNGVEIPSHRNFLIARSSVLQRMLEGEMEESKSGRISMNDISEKGIWAFLRFIYYGEVIKPEESTELAYDVLYAAHKYEVSTLEDVMMTYLLKRKYEDFDANVAFEIYAFVKRIDTATAQELKDKMIQIMRLVYDEVRELPEYKEVFIKSPNDAIELCHNLVQVEFQLPLKRKSDLDQQAQQREIEELQYLKRKLDSNRGIQSIRKTHVAMTNKTCLGEGLSTPSDVIIIAGNPAVEIPSHRDILIAHSPVLRRMLEESKNARIAMADISEEGVKAFLRFIYQGEVIGQEESINLAYEVLYAAKKYEVSTLEASMITYLLERKDEDFEARIAFKIYAIVRGIVTATAEELKDKMVKIMRLDYDEVKELPDFAEVFRKNPDDAIELCNNLVQVKFQLPLKRKLDLEKQIQYHKKEGFKRLRLRIEWYRRRHAPKSSNNQF